MSKRGRHFRRETSDEPQHQRGRAGSTGALDEPCFPPRAQLKGSRYLRLLGGGVRVPVRASSAASVRDSLWHAADASTCIAKQGFANIGDSGRYFCCSFARWNFETRTETPSRSRFAPAPPALLTSYECWFGMSTSHRFLLIGEELT